MVCRTGFSGGISKLLEFVKKLSDKKDHFLQYEIVWRVLCWSFGLSEIQDELMVVQFDFDYKFPKCNEPIAIGYSNPTSLIIKDVTQTTRNSKQSQKIEIVRVFQFDPNNHSYRILIMESSWKSLSNQATISLLLYMNIGSKLNVKNGGNVIHVFKENHGKSETTSARQHPDNSFMVCREFNGKYEVRIDVGNQNEKLSCSSEFIPLSSLDDKMAVKLSVKSNKVEIRDCTMKFSCAFDAENFKLSINRKKEMCRRFICKKIRTQYWPIIATVASY